MLWHKSDMSTAEQSQKVVTAHFPSNRFLRFGFARKGSTWPELVAPYIAPHPWGAARTQNAEAMPI